MTTAKAAPQAQRLCPSCDEYPMPLAWERDQQTIAELVAALRALDDEWTSFCPSGPDGQANDSITFADKTLEIWRMARAALAKVGEQT